MTPDDGTKTKAKQQFVSLILIIFSSMTEIGCGSWFGRMKHTVWVVYSYKYFSHCAAVDDVRLLVATIIVVFGASQFCLV